MGNRITKVLIGLCFCPFLLFWRRISSLFFPRLKPPHIILLYHQVLKEERKRFADQMDRLLRTGVPVSLEKVENRDDRRLAISVTFDDGIRNFLHNALPELVERKISATVFFPTDYFGRFPDWISGQDPDDESRWVMTVEEAKSLPPDLITAGSHVVHHRRLSRLSEEEIQMELVNSKTDLERIFGRRIETVAFPHGDFDERVVQASQEAGYRRAYAADPVWIDGFVTGRIDTNPGDWPLEFYLKSLGAYRWLPAAFYVKRLLLRRK
jgi:peptidoglycan/xylan/chitin deacetylase (PgdA/CDA1 family)